MLLFSAGFCHRFRTSPKIFFLFNHGIMRASSCAMLEKDMNYRYSIGTLDTQIALSIFWI